jgi:hypothetical protein
MNTYIPFSKEKTYIAKGHLSLRGKKKVVLSILMTMIPQGTKNTGRYSKLAKKIIFQVLERFYKADRVNSFILIALVTKLRLKGSSD